MIAVFFPDNIQKLPTVILNQILITIQQKMSFLLAVAFLCVWEDFSP